MVRGLDPACQALGPCRLEADPKAVHGACPVMWSCCCSGAVQSTSCAMQQGPELDGPYAGKELKQQGLEQGLHRVPD